MSARIPDEARKISEGIFDRVTLSSIEKLIRRGKLGRLEGIISTGKEANVYRGFLEDEEIAVKIYAVETSDFKNMDRYIRGDVRFPKWKNRRQLIYLWASKEFHNLSKVYQKINCPQPIAVEKNVLVMSFIGNKSIAAPRWKDLAPKNPKKDFRKVVNFMKKMYQEEELVHGDLSEYNILNWDEKPYLIDFSQGVLKTHPLAEKLLERDVRNLVDYLRELGREKKEKEILKKIRGKR